MNYKLEELGITAQHLADYRLRCHDEAKNLIDAGLDAFDRPAQMTVETMNAWHTMCAAAASQQITLQLVSAFRSIDYQCGLIQRKIDAGQLIDDILKVTAIPGYSEHHTGQALDLGTPGFEHLSENFDSSPAFSWLSHNAGDFGFHLSYPKHNALGIVYEPWHWKFGD